MKLTRAIFLALAFLIPTVSTVTAKADDKTAEPAPAPDAKKAKKQKKAKAKDGEEKKAEEGDKAAAPDKK